MNKSTLFHLAIPVKDLDEAATFYAKLGRVARRTKVSIIVDFFGHQLVCHLEPSAVPEVVTMYPRHFGIVFTSKTDFVNAYQWCKVAKLAFFTDEDKPGFIRFEGKPEEHQTFFIVDPSNNLIEFKNYVNPEWIFSPANKGISGA